MPLKRGASYVDFVPAPELQETVHKVISEGGKGVRVVAVRKREKWFLNLGEIAVDWWDIPKGEGILWDGKGQMLSQESHLQYRAVLFDALGIEQQGLSQTGWKKPFGDPDPKMVLRQGAWRPEGATAALGLGKRPEGMMRRNWKAPVTEEGQRRVASLTCPTLSRDSPAATKLTLTHLKKVEANISSQKVVDWMIDPVGTVTASLVHHRIPLPSNSST